MTDIIDSEVIEGLQNAVDPDDGRRPHRQPSVLKYALHDHVLSCADTAEAIESAFDYPEGCSKSMVHRAKNKHGIRDAVTDGPFADLLEGGDDGTEPAQPPSFFVHRSADTPIHPYDTNHFAPPSALSNEEVGDDPERNRESSTTPHFTVPPDSDSTAATADTTDSLSDSGTGVLKPLPDAKPSEWRVKRSNRDESLVAPPWAARDGYLPAKYHACGCGNCNERHFLDGDSGTIDCPCPVPVTVSGARRIYEKCEGTNWANNVEGNDVERALSKYACLMKADSAIFRQKSPGKTTFKSPSTDDVTTVLLSLRVAPTDDEGQLVTPYTLVQDVKDGWDEARNKLPTEAGEGRHGYFWTIAGTDYWASPHVHFYAWYHDPQDVVVAEDFRPIVERFVGASAFAPREAHFVDADDDNGDDVRVKEGCVRVEHQSLLVDPDRLDTRLGDDPFADISNDTTGPERLTKGSDVQSRGAVYVGSQLPRLALRGAESNGHTEIAAFHDVASDGRHVTRGCGEITFLADALDAISQYEELKT